MENSNIKSLTSQVQLLLKTNKDFPQKLKQHLVLESNNLKNPIEFMIKLIEGVLVNGSCDLGDIFGLKEIEIVIELAMSIACSKDVDVIGRLLNALEGSGNSQLITGLHDWLKQDFGIETDVKLSEPKEGTSGLQTQATEQLQKNMKSSDEMTPRGIKLIDKIMSHVEDDLVEQLESHLVGKVSELENVVEFCSNLVNQVVLDEADIKLTAAPEAQEGQRIEQMTQTACPKKAMGSFALSLQGSNNERILAEAYDRLETSPLMKRNNYPIAVQSPGHQQSKEEPKVAFFERAALPDGLAKIATFKWQQKSASMGISHVQFDKERMMACSVDGALNLWSSRGNEVETSNVAIKVKKITCFQYDEEILVLGTAAGTVHLYDARTFEEKWLVRLGDPVHSLKFVESALVVITRSCEYEQVWWVEISRPGMRLLNPRSVYDWRCFGNQISGVCVYPDTAFVYRDLFVHIFDTKSGTRVKDNCKDPCILTSPANISTLTVGDSISTKRVVVAGCIDGMIVMWSTSKLTWNQSPVKTFHWDTEPIVDLGSLNGHLLSLHQSGKILMWSGHDLENKHMTPVPRVFGENFSNVTSLDAHERWFATCSSKDDVINIWTLPDLWLRTG